MCVKFMADKGGRGRIGGGSEISLCGVVLSVLLDSFCMWMTSAVNRAMVSLVW